MAKKNSFVFYDEWCDLLDTMDEHEVFVLMRAVSAYRRGEDPEIEDPAVAMAFRMMRLRLDKNEKSYEEKCASRAEAGSKGGQAKSAKSNDTSNVANVANLANVANVANASKSSKTSNVMKCNDVKCNDMVLNCSEEIKTKEKSAKADQKKAAASAYAEDTELDQAVRDFIEHRKKLRKPMTDKAVELFMSRLDSMAQDTKSKIALINNAIEKGWQTVYPAREPPSGNDYLMSVINGEVEL